jgi:hypothetical protein
MNPRAVWQRSAPAVGLFFLAPFIAEFLLGDFALDGLPMLLVMAPMYGGAALVIREVVRRSGRGWPTILVLGLAYGVLEEGIVTQSLFNPDYAGLRLLDPAFIPALGIGASWTVFVLSLHAVWSIGASIGLAEALAARRDASRETTPWLSRRGLAVASVLFVLGSAAIGFGSAAGGFVASPAQLAGAAVVASALVVVAFRLPRTRSPRQLRRGPIPGARPVPRPRVVLAVGLVLGAAFFSSSWLTGSLAGWPAAAIVVLVWTCAAVSMSRWSGRSGWTRNHRLSLVAAAVLTYAWREFTATPVLHAGIELRVISNSLYAMLALGLLVLAWRGTRRDSELGSGLSPTRSDEPVSKVARREQIASLRGDGHLDRRPRHRNVQLRRLLARP